MNEDEKKKEEEKKRKVKSILLEKKLNYNLIEKLGKGGYGSVYKIQEKTNNTIYAFKLICCDKEDSSTKLEENISYRGPNIVKIINQGNDKYDYYYIMECSEIGSVKLLKKYLEKEENNRILENPFEERVGDNLIRFFAKQIINAIKTFYQGNLVHYDIKPPNILIFNELQVKMIDFSFLTQVIEGKDLIPGGTEGYLTPEYYLGDIFPKEVLQKQDYFAIGAVLYYLKYGEKMLKYKQEIDQSVTNKGYINSVTVTDLISIAINKIRTQKYQSKGFTEFLIKLIQYKPEERWNFEDILRNKWLNENAEELKKLKDIFCLYEDIMLVELQKSDFLINNKKYFRKNIDNKKDISKYKFIRRGKFKFGKKHSKNFC